MNQINIEIKGIQTQVTCLDDRVYFAKGTNEGHKNEILPSCKIDIKIITE